jgi:large repetitive protein
MAAGRRADGLLTTRGVVGHVCYLAPPVGLKRLFSLVVLALCASVAVPGSASAGSIYDVSPCPKGASGFLVCPVGTTGTSYSIKFRGDEEPICAPGDDKWYARNGSVPPGLSLATDGTLSGTPTQPGTYNFWLHLELPDYFNPDPPPGSGCSSRDNSEEQVTITIVAGVPAKPKLTIGPESATPGTTGKPYSLQMTASEPEPKTWTINSGTLPPGLALDASAGMISGTPTTAGTYSFEVLAKVVSDGRSDTKALGIVVRNPLAISGSDPFTSARKAQGEVSVPFSASLTATGGEGTYTWSLTSGELPAGLLLADGAIDGKPTEAGTFRFTASVTDGEGRVANYPARIVIAEKLAFSPLPLKPGKVGKYYSAKLRTVGGVKPATWRLVRGPLPRGLGFDRAFGEIYGTPKLPGRYRVTFEARDALGVKAKKTLLIVVAATPLKKKSG